MTLALILLYLAAVAFAVQARASHGGSVRDYAHRLTVTRWHSETEWRALDTIVKRESNWNPCASYPRHHDCTYTGSNSCGIPQANPCPSLWRGRLWETRFVQVEWLISYIAGRYSKPSWALAYWDGHGSY